MNCSNFLPLELVILVFSILTFVLWIQCYYYKQRYQHLKNGNFPEAIVIEEP